MSDKLSEDLSDVEDMVIGTCDDDDDDDDDGDDGGEDDSQDLDEVNRRDNGTLSALQKSVFNLLYKVESRFEHDYVTYKKAINTFVKQTEKINGKNDAAIQKALFTFAKDVFKMVKKGKRNNSGFIPVQGTSKSRRRIKHRGTGPSIQGRPTSEQSQKLQLEVNDEDEIFYHTIPSRNKAKRKHPHSLAKSVADNRASERKH